MRKRHCNIPIFLPHAACPFRCVFCDQHLITAQSEIPTPGAVRRMIQQALTTIPEKTETEAAFFGGNFTALPFLQQEEYLQTVQPWLKTGKIQSIRISTRPDCIDPEKLSWLKNYGVRVIELGIQSFDSQVLRATGRGYTVEQARRACRAIKKSGIQLGIQLMPGLPQDTPEKSVASARIAVEEQADMVRIYPTVVLRSTPLEKMMQEGTYQALSVEEAIEIAKTMRLIFEAHQIPVIRVGLHAGEDLQDPHNICGGAFHPAFGERVEQRIFYEQTQTLLQALPVRTDAPTIFLNQRDLSKFLGWRRENWRKLKQKYGRISVRGISSDKKNWIGVGGERALEPEYVLRREDYVKMNAEV